MLIRITLFFTIFPMQAMIPTTAKRLKQLPIVSSGRFQRSVSTFQKTMLEKPYEEPKDWRLYLKPTKELRSSSWVSQLVLKINAFLYGQKTTIVPVPGLDEFIGQLKDILYDQDIHKAERLAEKIRLFNPDNFDKKQVTLYVAALMNSYIDWLKAQGQLMEVDRMRNSVIGLLADFIEYLYLLENPTLHDWEQFLKEQTSLYNVSISLKLFSEFEPYRYKYTNEKMDHLLGLRPGISYEFIKNKYDHIVENYSPENIISAVRNGYMGLREANVKLAWMKNLKNAWERYYPTIPVEERNRYEYGQKQLKIQQAKENKYPVEREYNPQYTDIHVLLNLPADALYAQVKEKYLKFMEENHFDKVRNFPLAEQIARIEKAKAVTQAMKRYEDERKTREGMRE